jgi:hypothetical protein
VSIELFPASEGFLRTKIHKRKRNVTAVELGIFYEFIKVTSFIQSRRYTIGEVALECKLCFDNFYQCGTLGYNIGDTVQFTSLKPYRIIVSGRIKHYISAFGEHVIGKSKVLCKKPLLVLLFELMNLRWHHKLHQGLPYHEWFIEFDQASGEPENYVAFAEALDNAMRKQNMYYDDLIVGKVLKNWWLPSS